MQPSSMSHSIQFSNFIIEAKNNQFQALTNKTITKEKHKNNNKRDRE